MRTEKNDKDKDWQRMKEVLVEIILDIGTVFMRFVPYALIIVLLILVFAGLTHGAALDKGIVSITYTNGTTYYNPNSDLYDANIVCADGYTRLKMMCDRFCGYGAKSFYGLGLYWHRYSLSHFDLMQNYPRHWEGWNFTALQAQNYENANIAWYVYFQDACDICNGIEEVKPVYVR
jgi:hypothetical protein